MITFISVLITSMLGIVVMIYDVLTGKISQNPKNARTIALMFYCLLILIIIKVNISLYERLNVEKEPSVQELKK
ncbi:MAG: hypothetical protein JST94_03615 [Bacteroidetes bacterium]|nr:hypothetical protein [Bacteroidota bacterium]MBS1670526.1 hypothetical protein [Bacteroidota bacterium]